MTRVDPAVKQQKCDWARGLREGCKVNGREVIRNVIEEADKPNDVAGKEMEAPHVPTFPNPATRQEILEHNLTHPVQAMVPTLRERPGQGSPSLQPGSRQNTGSAHNSLRLRLQVR